MPPSGEHNEQWYDPDLVLESKILPLSLQYQSTMKGNCYYFSKLLFEEAAHEDTLKHIILQNLNKTL